MGASRWWSQAVSNGLKGFQSAAKPSALSTPVRLTRSHLDTKPSPPNAGIMSEGAAAFTCRPQRGPACPQYFPRTPARDGGSLLSDVDASTWGLPLGHENLKLEWENGWPAVFLYSFNFSVGALVAHCLHAACHKSHACWYSVARLPAPRPFSGLNIQRTCRPVRLRKI